MVRHRALSTLATRGGETGVGALRVDARLSRSTLGVRGASGNAETVLADVPLRAVCSTVAKRSAGALHANLVQETVVV